VVNAQFVIFKSADLTKVQSGFRLLDVLGVWLPIVVLVLVLVLVGEYVAKSHRRAFIGAGLGIAGAMLVLGIALTVFRQVYLDSVPADVLPHDAAASLYDTLIRFMRASLRRTAVAAVVIAAAGFLTGPSTAAVTTRRVLGNGIAALRRATESAGLRTGQVGEWVYSYRGPLRVATVVVAAAVLIVRNEPSITVILTVTAVTLLVLALVEFLARSPGPQPDGTSASDPSTEPVEFADLSPRPAVARSGLIPTDAQIDR
jgi:hypothetical protein